jgi:hypothetical protein
MYIVAWKTFKIEEVYIIYDLKYLSWEEKLAC